MSDESYREGYEVGHREGEGCREVDWTSALSEVLPDEVEATPSAVAAYIAAVRPLLMEVYHQGRAAFIALGLEADWPDGFVELIDKAGDLAYPDLDGPETAPK